MLSFTFFDSTEWTTSGTSERFVSEEAYKTQQKLKDEYMSRDTKHMETISELREQLAAKQDYIKTLEEHNENQKKEITNLLKKQEKLKAEIVTKSNIIFSRNAACNMLNAKIMKLNEGIRDSEDLTWKEKYDELENENKVLKERLKEATGIDYTDSTDYISQLGKNILNQRKELRNLNKVLERERKRNKELEELYSSAQKDVSMLNLKVMELNQGIRDSADLTWKEKYDRLKETHNDLREKYTNELRKRLKQRDDKIEALETGIKELSTGNDDLHGIRDSADLTWKEKYDELEEKWRKKYRELNERYISDSAALNAVINDVRGRLKLRENKIEALETGIKELSTGNDDLKKKIRSMEYNEMYTTCLKDRCSKAEHTIDVIKRALVDSDYILRRNDK